MYTGLRPETDRARESPAAAARTLVMLGDSIVYGWGVSYGQSYPALVESWLNQNEPATPWRVINAGVPGDTVVMGSERYARDVDPFKPELVLLAFGLNDGALRMTQFDAQREQLWRAAHHPADKAALMARRWVKTALARLGAVDDAPQQVQRDAVPRVGHEMFVRVCSTLIDRARRDGAEPVLAPLAPVASPALASVARPRMSRAQWESYARCNHLIAELALREGASLVDLGGAPQPEGPAEMLAEDGVHMTASGQRWLATRVYATLTAMMEAHARPDSAR